MREATLVGNSRWMNLDSVDFKANQIEYIYWLSWFCLQSYKKYYKSQSAEQPQDANHPMLLVKK